MPDQYERISNFNPAQDAENFNLPPNIGAPDLNSPGQKILAFAGQIAGLGNQVTVADLYQAFLGTKLRPSWEWRPAGSGYSANRYGILDGTKLFGECKHFAYALWTLARVPPPFGLGLPHSQVKLETYTGALGHGFVSAHPRRFLQLSKNVKRPPGNLDRLYYWENHKTVSFNNVYYDICYETTYPAEAAMALYTLTNVYAPPGPTQMVAEMAVRISNGRNFWFKRIQPSDNVINPRRTWLGPIDETTFETKYLKPSGLNVKV